MRWPTMEQKLGLRSQILGSYAVSAVGGIAMSGDWGEGVVVVLLVVLQFCLWVSHHCYCLVCHWVVGGQMCCGKLAKIVRVPNLRVVPGVRLLGEGGGLLVGPSIVCLMLRVSSCGESHIGRCVLWECHKRGVVGFCP